MHTHAMLFREWSMNVVKYIPKRRACTSVPHYPKSVPHALLTGPSLTRTLRSRARPAGGISAGAYYAYKAAQAAAEGTNPNAPAPSTDAQNEDLKKRLNKLRAATATRT